MFVMTENIKKEKINSELIQIKQVNSEQEKKELLAFCDTKECKTGGTFYCITINDETAGFIKIAQYDPKEFNKVYELGEYITTGLGTHTTVEIELLYIKEQFRFMGIGSQAVNWVKSFFENRRIVLFTLIESEDFWINQSFKEYRFPLKENPKVLYAKYVYYYE